MHRRSWLFSVLTAAHTPVVLDLAADIDVATSALTPKHYRSLEAAVTVFARSALKRQLSLREPLRLGRITYSARTLWLLRPLVTENSAEQVAKKFTAGFEDLLLPAMGDRRSVLRTIGAAKTVQIDTLRGTRDVLPVGAWAGDVKLGAMSRATATDILNHPDLWRVDIWAARSGTRPGR